MLILNIKVITNVNHKWISRLTNVIRNHLEHIIFAFKDFTKSFAHGGPSSREVRKKTQKYPYPMVAMVAMVPYPMFAE